MTQPRRIIWFLISAAAILFVPSQAAAQAVLTDDALTSSATPSRNYGFWISLSVNSTSNSYLKFDLSRVSSAGITPKEITQATLRLWVEPFEASGAIDVYQVNGPWSEATITSANAPTVNSPPAVSDVILTPASQLHYITIDVTSLVQGWLSNPASNQGIALVAHPNTGISVLFDSKENILTAHEPELDIATSGAAGAPGAAATVAVGSTTTVAAGGQAAVTNSGTPSAAILNFTLPQGTPGGRGTPGAPGAAGQAATVAVGQTMTVPAGTPATVLNGGTSSAAVLNFMIPQGPMGLPGAAGANGLTNRGLWNNGTPYNANDGVFDSASYWLATTANTGSEPSPTNTNWQLLAGGIVNRGSWNGTNSYNVNDAVSDGGSYWLALTSTSSNNATPNTSCEPSHPTCAADWQLLASQGGPGPIGMAATVQVGQITTGGPGTQAAVTNTGNPTAAVLNFTIPQGPIGPAGLPGPQGPPGSSSSPANLSGAPLLASAFFASPLIGNGYTASKIIPDNPITITRVTAEVESAGDPSCGLAVIRVGNGTKGEDLYLSGNQTESDSGSGMLTLPAGTSLRVSLKSGAVCTSGTGPSNANVTIEYRTQNTNDADSCPSGQISCNGICESPGLDPGNCGSCGTNCSTLANTVSGQSCTAGACVFTCATGFADCDKNPSNGCETNIQTNQNCGTCGTVCPSQTACSNSTCCPAGQTGCSGSCTALSSDVNNCGACGNSCPSDTFGAWTDFCSSGKCLGGVNAPCSGSFLGSCMPGLGCCTVGINTACTQLNGGFCPPS